MRAFEFADQTRSRGAQRPQQPHVGEQRAGTIVTLLHHARSVPARLSQERQNVAFEFADRTRIGRNESPQYLVSAISGPGPTVLCSTRHVMSRPASSLTGTPRVHALKFADHA
jgi:hypothetical protein